MVSNPFGTLPNDHFYMKALRELKEIREKACEPSWIYPRERELYARMLEYVNRPQVFHTAMQTLGDVLPVLKSHENFPQWQEIVVDALVSAADSNSNRLQAETYLHLGYFLLREGDHFGARNATDIAHARVVESSDLEMEIRCYALFFQSQILRNSQDLKRQTVYNALRLAKRLEKDSPVRAELYQALATYHAYTRNVRASEAYRRSARRIWNRLDYLPGKWDCALIHATNALARRHYSRVSRIVHLLQSQPWSNGVTLLTAYALYTLSASALEENKLQTALEGFKEAESRFRKAARHPMIATCNHAMALAYAADGHFRLSMAHLAHARRIWRRLQVTGSLIEIQIAQSYIYRQMRNRSAAAAILDRAWEAIRQIEEKSTRKYLEDAYWDERNKLGDVDDPPAQA